jgi:catechol 2,3-dioxygenase-like lactoylglutathione lyase family enzyme
MSLHTGGLHHLAIRVTDLARAKRFYTNTLGFQVVLEVPGSVVLNAHGTFFGLRGDDPETTSDDRFDPYRVGLDHLALAVPNIELLQELKQQLDAESIRNNGVEDDSLLGARYIAFYDPDGIAWELYAMLERA